MDDQIYLDYTDPYDGYHTRLKRSTQIESAMPFIFFIGAGVALIMLCYCCGRKDSSSRRGSRDNLRNGNIYHQSRPNKNYDYDDSYIANQTFMLNDVERADYTDDANGIRTFIDNTDNDKKNDDHHHHHHHHDGDGSVYHSSHNHHDSNDNHHSSHHDNSDYHYSSHHDSSYDYGGGGGGYDGGGDSGGGYDGGGGD